MSNQKNLLAVAIVGLGVHGMRYVKHVTEDVEGMRLLGVCRRDIREAESVGYEWGVRPYNNVTTMLAELPLDVLIVVTPPPSHLPIARVALEQGVAVVLEKPITHTLDEAQQLQRLVEDNGTPLCLTQSLRYNQALLKARQEIKRIGEIRSLTVSQRLPHTPLLWQNSHSTHPLGSILNTGVHLYDLVRWMLQAEFANVFSQAERVENPFHEDLFKTQARLVDRQVLVAMEVAKCTQSRSSLLTLVGERGQIHVDYQQDQVLLFQDGKIEELKSAEVAYTIPLLLNDVCRALNAGEEMPITVADGVRTMEVVEASYRSVASGRSEAV